MTHENDILIDGKIEVLYVSCMIIELSRLKTVH